MAFQLKMPLYKLLEEMTYEELLGWLDYFNRRPIGWRDDARMVPVLRTQGVKEKPEVLFPSLAAVYRKEAPPDGKIPASQLKASAFFSKMLGAVGGDKLEVFNDKS